MKLKSATLLSMALGAVLIVNPSLTPLGDNLGYDAALAAKGGNGNGGAGGKGKGADGNSNRGGNSASVSGAKGPKAKAEKSLTSQMGALNSINASANAFLHASPNSRVGRVKAAVLAERALIEAQAAATADAAALEGPMIDAFGSEWEPGIGMTQAEFDEAMTSITDPIQAEELRTAYGEWQAAVQADADLALAQETADEAWEAAANKPVTQPVKDAVMQLAVDKIPELEPTTP